MQEISAGDAVPHPAMGAIGQRVGKVSDEGATISLPGATRQEALTYFLERSANGSKFAAAGAIHLLLRLSTLHEVSS